jgi:ubiquinone/menaquinone biosynthesis C-methylase UbiE
MFSLEDLDKQGEDYSKSTSVNYSAYIYKYRYRVVRDRMTGPNVLEVGVGHADVTNWLSEDGSFKIVSIDGSKAVLEYAAQKVTHPERVTFVHTYFEEFESDTLFDDILITNSLEHVDDPVGVLKHIQQFLKPTGYIHITVPNAMSIHRMLGKEMGMLENEWSLNSHDIKVGHQRVYTLDLLRMHINKAGLKDVIYDGVILKALSNVQMNDLIDTYGEKVIDGLFAVGRRLPELAAELYICCRK